MIAVADARICTGVLQSFEDTAECLCSFIYYKSAPHPICSLPFFRQLPASVLVYIKNSCLLCDVVLITLQQCHSSCFAVCLCLCFQVELDFIFVYCFYFTTPTWYGMPLIITARIRLSNLCATFMIALFGSLCAC